MAWFRIDNRLIHGQVVEGWLPYLDAGALVVVNDALAEDTLRQQIMRLAIPDRVQVRFIPLSKAQEMYATEGGAGGNALYLLADCRDAARLVREQGMAIAVLNVGNMHYSPGKRQICAHVAASQEDLRCLDAFRQNGTELDFRCVPTDLPVVEEW